MRIEIYNGRKKVMWIARLFQPTKGDVDAVHSIMKEHMTTPYRHIFEHYVHDYALLKYLRIVKLWLWDVRDGRQLPPYSSEEQQALNQRVSKLLSTAHKYDVFIDSLRYIDDGLLSVVPLP